MTNILLPDHLDVLVGSNFGKHLDFGFEQPDHTITSTSGSGTVSFDQNGVSVESDGSGDDASIEHTRFNNASPNVLFYWAWDELSTTTDTSGVAQVGGRSTSDPLEGVGIDCIEREVFCSGTTRSINIDPERLMSVHCFVDNLDGVTYFFLQNRSEKEVIEVPESFATDIQSRVAGVADGEHEVVVKEMGWTHLWEVPISV